MSKTWRQVRGNRAVQADHVPLPPLATIAAALRKTTEALALELASTTTQPPAWTAFEWRMARVAAVIHGISPLLATRLRWSGPGDWDQFLQQQKSHVEQRHQRIERLMKQIDIATRLKSVGVTALKGAAMHRVGLCQAGERPMGDIDLLVRPPDLSVAAQLLPPLGYHESATTWRHKIFEPVDYAVPAGFGEHPDTPIKIEVHTKIAERLPWSEIDITRDVQASEVGVGVQHYATTDALMLHQLLHAAGNMSSRWLRMLQLSDIATIAALMRDADWARLLANDGVARRRWWAYPPLRLTARYFPDLIPGHVLTALARHCPTALRFKSKHCCLSDVSSSSLWVAAVPAAVWAKTPTELGTYLWRRLRPSPDEMATLGESTRAQPWAVEDTWYSNSQRRRLMQWTFSRPARPQILHAVRLAQQSA